MKSLFTCIVILVVSQMHAQRIRHVQNNNNYYIKTIQKLNLPEVESSGYKFHFRFAYTGRVLDIWKDGSQIKGEVLFYIFECKHLYEDSFRRIYTKKYILDSIAARKIWFLIDSSNILDIPDQSSIKGWEEGLTDGTVYNFEHSDSQNYFYKSFNSPYRFDSLIEAKKIINFTKRIYDILFFYEIFPYFRTTKPFLCTSNDGSTNTTYGVANKEKRRSVKLREQQIKRFKKGKPIQDGYIIYKE
jgi:hypothetical protein